MGIECHPESEAELRVVLEERVRPRWAAPIAIRRIRGGRQVAAINRRTSRGIRHEEPITEELSQQLDVGGLPAARARPGILEQWFHELGMFMIDPRDPGPIHLREIEEEVVVDAFSAA